MSISVFDLLNSRNFCQYNRTLAVEIGMAEAILLCELISSYKYFKEKNELVTIKGVEGFFYETAEKIFQRTGMKKDLLQAARNRLIACGFLETRDYGMPCRKFYRLNEETILSLFKEISTRSGNSRNKMEAPIKNEKIEEEHPPTRNMLEEIPLLVAGIPATGLYIYNEPKEEPEKDSFAQSPPGLSLCPHPATPVRTEGEVDKKNLKHNMYDQTSPSPTTPEKPIASPAKTVKFALPPKPKDQLVFDFAQRKFVGITEEDLKIWRELYPNCDLRKEILKAEEWCYANPARQKQLWRRFLTNWLNKAEQQGYERKASQAARSGNIQQRNQYQNKTEEELEKQFGVIKSNGK